jgi:hypothetical protein
MHVPTNAVFCRAVPAADGDAPVVRVINAALSSEITAQGGTVDFMVQMVLPNTSDSSSSSSNGAGRRLRISPGIASVYLNGEMLEQGVCLVYAVELLPTLVMAAGSSLCLCVLEW